MSKRQRSKRKIPRADDTRPRGGDSLPPQQAAGCHCLNHMGTRKVAHKTREDAVEAALRQVRRGRAARVYPCPTSERFHVATSRMKG